MPISPHVAEEIAQLERRQARISAADHDRDRPRDRDAMIRAQVEYDDIFKRLGTGGAPPPLHEEGEASYRGRLASTLQPLTTTYRDSNLYALVPSPPVEAGVIAEVEQTIADRRRGDLETGTGLRAVTTQENGITRTVYHGADPRVWMNQFAPPFQVATEIMQFDKAGNPAPPVVKWGHPPRR
jgi:hypothetical protein